MRAYLRVQVIASVYLVFYISSLYFASGVHNGFKLDDNQLTEYIIYGIMSSILILSFFAKSLIKRRWFAGLLLGCSFALLGISIFNIVSFNEAIAYFIIFMLIISLILLFETVVFGIEKR